MADPFPAPNGLHAIVDVENRDRVTGRWFDLWAGAVAVNGMCVTRGLAGTSSLPGGLSITLSSSSITVESNITTTT